MEKPVLGQAEISTPDVLYRERLGKLLELADDQKRRLVKFIKKNLEVWETDTADLHDRLISDNDLVENVIEDTGYPYEGAPNVHVPVTSIYVKIYKSMAKRSILGSDDIWHCKLEPDAYGTPTEQAAAAIADMANYKAANEWNIAQGIEDVLHPTSRDGLGVLKIPFVEETENVVDVLIFDSYDEFVAKFPTAQDAGMDQEVYLKTAEKAQQATPKTPLEIPIEMDKVVYSGPKAKVVELSDFVTFPANCLDLSAEHCKGYGELFTLRKGAVKAKGKAEVWYPEAVKKVVKARSKDPQSEMRKAKDEIVGLGASESDEIRFLEITIRFALDRGGDERKLLVTYAPEHEEIMAVMDYPYRVDFYSLFRIEKRTNELIGNSIPNQTRDLNELMDTQMTQRILSREISTVPSFKGKKSAKGDFDPEAPENRWRPGVIFWLEDPEAFDQFKVQPTDLGESMQEEKNAMSMLDLLLGSSASLMSGQASTSDPSAPGNKTAMMIGQSNMRMDDPLSTLRDGVDKVGDICMSHLYQFGPAIISYVANEGQEAVRTLQKKVLRGGFKMSMNGVTVVENPSSEMARWLALYAQLVADPMVAENPDARAELLRMALRAGRIPNRDKIVPTPQELHEKQVMIVMEAQKRMAVEKLVTGMAQRQQAAEGRESGLKKELATRALAQRIQAQGEQGEEDAAQSE